jgi:hypothetical protein
VIRAFGLTDIFLVRNLQRSSAILAIEHTLTHPRQPLWMALTAPWPLAGTGVATYVLDDREGGSRLTGFVQLMKRSTRPEADLLYLAPALPANPERDPAKEQIWSRLLQYCNLALAGHGLQRIFASIPDEGAEQACLKEAGFCFYAREIIYRLAVVPPPGPALAGFRWQRPKDSWALQRLYTRGTPRLVQSAEGGLNGEVGSPPLSWWEPDRWQGLVWEPAGEVRGAVQVHVGRAGHWLRLWGGNSLAPRELRHLIEQGLRLLADLQKQRRGKPLPVYVTVRDYETEVGPALTGFGFAPYAWRARFVRHMLAEAREPVLTPLAALETAHEVPAIH